MTYKLTQSWSYTIWARPIIEMYKVFQVTVEQALNISKQPYSLDTLKSKLTNSMLKKNHDLKHFTLLYTAL